MEKLDDNDFQLFTKVARQLWLRRNIVVHGGLLLPPAAVMKQAREQIVYFEQAMEARKKYPGDPTGKCRVKKWEKPPERVVKVNWDAAISTDLNLTGMGVILRDHMGEVLASFCTFKPIAMEPVSAEALAAWYATEISKKQYT
jgi:hypothetical protein